VYLRLSDWTRLQWHCTACSTWSRRVHSLDEGWLCSSSQILCWHWSDRTYMYCLTFFALYVGKIQIWCIFIVRCHSSLVYAIVVCPSVWCGCSVVAAVRLDSSAVGIVQLAHAVDESILCCEWWRCCSSQMTLERTCWHGGWGFKIVFFCQSQISCQSVRVFWLPTPAVLLFSIVWQVSITVGISLSCCTVIHVLTLSWEVLFLVQFIKIFISWMRALLIIHLDYILYYCLAVIVSHKHCH